MAGQATRDAWCSVSRYCETVTVVSSKCCVLTNFLGQMEKDFAPKVGSKECNHPASGY